jgi:hypothetical protein
MEREKIIELPVIADKRGILSFAETGQLIPFQTAQIYYITKEPDLKPDEAIFIPLSGSFRMTVNDTDYVLDKPDKALYIPESLPRIATNFSCDAICLIISPKKESKDKDLLPKKYKISDCSLIKLTDKETNGRPVENIPFDIKRIFYIYNIPLTEKRGSHAHKLCHEILIAAKGSFDVELDDGINKQTVALNNPEYGLHVPPGIWAVEKGYTPNAICLVFASDRYDAENYINSHRKFIEYRRNEN